MHNPELVHEVVPERASGSVNEEIAWFVDSKQPLVFIHDSITEIGSRLLELSCVVGNDIIGADRIAGMRGFVIYQDFA
jgi:hypothetical protein